MAVLGGKNVIIMTIKHGTTIKATTNELLLDITSVSNPKHENLLFDLSLIVHRKAYISFMDNKTTYK